MAIEWFVKADGSASGPYTSTQLKTMAANRQVQPESEVRQGTDGKWVAAQRVKGLFTESVVKESSKFPPENSTATPKQPNTESPLDGDEIAKLLDEGFEGKQLRNNVVEGNSLSNQKLALQNPKQVDQEGQQPTLPPSPPTKACKFCGETILRTARKCKHCGEFIDGASPRDAAQMDESDKKALPMLLLFLFLPGIGAHAFYAGNIVQGLFYLFLWPSCGVCSLLLPPPISTFCLVIPLIYYPVLMLSDLIRIISGSYKDGSHRKITKWT